MLTSITTTPLQEVRYVLAILHHLIYPLLQDLQHVEASWIHRINTLTSSSYILDFKNVAGLGALGQFAL